VANPPSSTDPPGEPPGRRLFSKVGMAIVVEVLAGLVIGFFALGSDAGPSDTPSTTPTESYRFETVGDEPGSTYTEPESEPETDPVADAGVGDCFENHGAADDFDLEPSGCDAEAFEVVDVYSDASGVSACDGVDESVFGHDPGYGSVLCLSYLHPWGDAYYAEPGECVTRADDGTYRVAECEPGVFRVLERFWDERDSDRCSEWEHYNGSLDFPGYWDEQDLLLCMRIEYPDDIGSAATDTCLYASGPDGDMRFEFADCSQSNVYVTGRSPEYDHPGFCEGYGWATWRSNVFPDHAYTVCFAWL
jgi:hypothetical protein